MDISLFLTAIHYVISLYLRSPNYIYIYVYLIKLETKSETMNSVIVRFQAHPVVYRAHNVQARLRQVYRVSCAHCVCQFQCKYRRSSRSRQTYHLALIYWSCRAVCLSSQVAATKPLARA